MLEQKRAGMGHWTAALAFAGAAMATYLPSASTLAAHEPTALPVVFEEPESVAQDDLGSSAAADFARPSNAPALPIDANDPSRRCGNMMRDLDDLCQYAGAAPAASGAMVTPR